MIERPISLPSNNVDYKSDIFIKEPTFRTMLALNDTYFCESEKIMSVLKTIVPSDFDLFSMFTQDAYYLWMSLLLKIINSSSFLQEYENSVVCDYCAKLNRIQVDITQMEIKKLDKNTKGTLRRLGENFKFIEKYTESEENYFKYVLEVVSYYYKIPVKDLSLSKTKKEIMKLYNETLEPKFGFNSKIEYKCSNLNCRKRNNSYLFNEEVYSTFISEESEKAGEFNDIIESILTISQSTAMDFKSVLEIPIEDQKFYIGIITKEKMIHQKLM